MVRKKDDPENSRIIGDISTPKYFGHEDIKMNKRSFSI